MHSDQHIIQGIQNNDKQVLSGIYRDCFPLISQFIQKNAGTESDAEDIMQRALIAIYERTFSEPNFQLTSKFSTFLYGVAKNLWMKEIRRKKATIELTKMELEESIVPEVDLVEEDLFAQRHLLFWTSFEKMGESCQKILRKFFEGIAPKEIAQDLGIKYESYRVQKTRCVKKLATIINSNPAYQELKRT